MGHFSLVQQTRQHKKYSAVLHRRHISRTCTTGMKLLSKVRRGKLKRKIWVRIISPWVSVYRLTLSCKNLLLRPRSLVWGVVHSRGLLFHTTSGAINVHTPAWHLFSNPDTFLDSTHFISALAYFLRNG